MNSFTDTSRTRSSRIRSLVSIESAEPYISDYPESWGARVTVITADGQRITSHRDRCKGDPEVALDREQMIAKAHSLLTLGGLTEAGAIRVIDQVLDMPTSTTSTKFIKPFLDNLNA